MGTGLSLRQVVYTGLPAVLLGAIAVFVLVDNDGSVDASVPRAATASAPPTTEPPTPEEAAAAIEVEAGMTAGQVIACRTAGGDRTGFYPAAELCPPEQRDVIGDGVSFGIVLTNTSDQVLIQIPLTYRFLDAAGQVVPEPSTLFSDADPTSDDGMIDTLRPGEKFGFGGMTYRDRPGAERIEVVVGPPDKVLTEQEFIVTYTPLGASELQLTADLVTIEDIELSYGRQNEPVVSYTAVSHYDRAFSPMAYAVFRNSAGQVIGGADGSFSDIIVANGSTRGEISLDDPIEVPGIDPATVAVYLSPFAV
jgi:hypothetical protein